MLLFSMGFDQREKYLSVTEDTVVHTQPYCDEMPESRNRVIISQVMRCKSLHDSS
jgi:hypothetical protein